MRLFLALAFLMAALAPAWAQPAGQRRDFREWTAECRADGYCAAISRLDAAADGTDAEYRFSIGRHAQGNYWELSFTTLSWSPHPEAAMTFTVDGVADSFERPHEIVPYGDASDYFLLGKKAQAVMDRLMPGSTLDVAFSDENDESHSVTFSLDGLTAALIWIDETQNRLGSERVAEAPPEGLAVASSQPVLDLRTVRLVALHNGASGCSNQIGEDTYTRVGAVALDQYHTLYTVPCEDFAYNFISALYVATDEGLAPALLPESDAAAGDLGNTVYAGGWDEVTGVLTSFYKGGNGNCGSEGKWQWTGEKFELIELRARETCDESTEEWPIVAGGPK